MCIFGFILTWKFVTDGRSVGFWHIPSGVAQEQACLPNTTVPNNSTAQGLRLKALHVLSDRRDSPVRSAAGWAGRSWLLLLGSWCVVPLWSLVELLPRVHTDGWAAPCNGWLGGVRSPFRWLELAWGRVERRWAVFASHFSCLRIWLRVVCLVVWLLMLLYLHARVQLRGFIARRRQSTTIKPRGRGWVKKKLIHFRNCNGSQNNSKRVTRHRKNHSLQVCLVYCLYVPRG